MLREDNTRRGFFAPDQFAAARSHLPSPLQPVASFAYLTGWRVKSEILPLEWRQIDWSGRFVRLDPGTTKNGEGRSFPFTVALEALLKEQLADHERLKKEDRIVPQVFHRDAHESATSEQRGRQRVGKRGVRVGSLTTSFVRLCATSKRRE